MNSIKKLFAALLMVCAAPSLFAYDTYVGGVIGIGSFAGSYRAHNLTTDELHFVRGDGLSFLGGGQIGVEEYYENFMNQCGQELYGAFELNFLYNSYSRSIKTDTNTSGILNQGVHLKNNFLFGADFKLGKRFCNATPYLVAGYTLGTWKVSLLNNSGTTNLGVSASGNEHHKTLSGVKFGTGVRYDICDCVFFDFQYSYCWFGDIKRDFDIVVGEVSRQIWRHKVNVDQQRIVLGFNWIFGN